MVLNVPGRGEVVANDIKRGSSVSTLTISGVEVAVSHERVSVDELRLDPNNPRIRFQIAHGSRKQPKDDEELLELIRDQPGYDELQKQIRTLGGIYDPLIVRSDGTVVEGNTRLAALKFLRSGRNDAKWSTVPITRLPADISEETVEMLMANFHIAGKTVWRPSAQAEHIYRLIKERRIDPQRVADETRMTKKKVEQYVQAYEYLINEVLPEAQLNGKVNRQAILEKKFHHALEFVTGKKLQQARESPETRKTVAKMIAQDQITGYEVRKLPELMGNKKSMAVLVKDGVKAASNALKKADPTVDSKLLKAMKSMSDLLNSMKQEEMTLLRTNAKAREVLAELAQSVATVEDFVAAPTSRPGARNA